MQFDRDKFFEGIRDAQHLIDHLSLTWRWSPTPPTES
jgi:hypothetical protein